MHVGQEVGLHVSRSITPQVLIFDFDGTLVDSKAGILTCLTETLRERGLSWQEPLDWFLGPPAHVSMPRLLPSATPAEHKDIVEAYRTRYGKTGWLQGTVYPGVRTMLEALHRGGHRMFICTAKRRDFTLQMLENLALACFFEGIYADSVDMPSHNKFELLRTLLIEHQIVAGTMIGDRVFDVEAGRTCGLRTIAVSYGYGSPEEFAVCRPDFVCRSPTEVLDVVYALSV